MKTPTRTTEEKKRYLTLNGWTWQGTGHYRKMAFALWIHPRHGNKTFSTTAAFLDQRKYDNPK